MDTVTQGVMDVLAERNRQIVEEGHTLEHDDAHVQCELSMAAACYALAGGGLTLEGEADYIPFLWPWDEAAWKPEEDTRRNLVKAGALILAEIERIDREVERSIQEIQG